MSTKNGKKQAIDSAIGLGAMSQLSKNTKIQGVGETLFIFALLAGIGEILKFIIIKPIIFITKGMFKLMWWMCKSVYYYLPKFIYQETCKLYKYISGIRKTV